MSGVIDEYGQWEHCNNCGKFVLIQKLLYEQPSVAHPYGRDLCPKCTKELGVTEQGTVVMIAIRPKE